MPKRIDLTELQSIEIGGVAVALAYARGKRATLLVGGYDRDGLLETEADCRGAAARIRAKIDLQAEMGQDSS